MAQRTTRDKLKRVLEENCIRNNQASMERIAEFFAIYSEAGEEAQEVAASLAFILEGYTNLSAFINKVNESI